MPMATTSQRSIEIIVAVLFLMLVPVGFLVHSFNTLPSGYVAPYTVLAMWFLTLLVTILAAILVAIPRTRSVGFGFAVAIVFIPLMFFVGVKLSEKAGFNRWLHAPMVRIGPDVSASVVVYYKLGTTRSQMDEIENSAIHQTREHGRGIEFKQGIRTFSRLSRSQADGHDGFALTFFASVSPAQRESVISALTQSPYVFSVHTDIAPAAIPNPEPKSH